MMKMPFKKGEKIWIELEATEDGDMFDSDNKEIEAFIWSRENKGIFKVIDFISKDTFAPKLRINKMIDYLEGV